MHLILAMPGLFHVDKFVQRERALATLEVRRAMGAREE